MDGNKDEAQRCIDFAVQALAAGKIEKAEKFLLKAERLFPTDNAKSKDNKGSRSTGSTTFTFPYQSMRFHWASMLPFAF